MKTTKITAFTLIAAIFFLTACKDDASPKTANDLEKIKAELEAKKKELSDKQQIAELEKELKDVESQIKAVDKNYTGAGKSTDAVTPPPASVQVNTTPVTTSGPKGTITGNSVTMRKDASVQSDKLGSFNANEVVTVLETKNVNNENEAILTKQIALYVSQAAQTGSANAALTLPKGKAVVIESYDDASNKYYVSYQDTKQGKLYATINADALETISYSTWYRVQRSNGQSAWVLGKFLKTN